MKTLIFAISLAFFIGQINAQVKNEPINIEKKQYFQSGEKLNSKQLQSILDGNDACAIDYAQYRKNAKIAAPFQIGGSVCVLMAGVTSLGSSLKQAKDLNEGNLPGEYSSGLGWALGGLVLVAVAVPFSLKARKHLNSAVGLYNADLQSAYRKSDPQFEFTASGSTIGLRLTF